MSAYEIGLRTEVKSIIRSLVLSSPDNMSIDRLSREYYLLEGQKIPFARLGYGNLESFLLSIPDTVMVFGSGLMAVLKPVFNSKTAHIQQLVQGQKKPSGSRNRGRGRKPKFGFPKQNSNLVFDNERITPKYNHTQLNLRPVMTPTVEYIPPPQPSKPFVRCVPRFYQSPMEQQEPKKYVQIQTESKTLKELTVLTKRLTETQITQPIQVQEEQNVCPERTQSKPSVAESQPQPQKEKVAFIEDVAPLIYESDENKRNTYETGYYEDGYISSSEGSDTDAMPAYAMTFSVLATDYPSWAVRQGQKLPKRDLSEEFKLHHRIQLQMVTISTPHKFYFWIHDDLYDEFKSMAVNIQRFYNNFDVNKYKIPLHLISVGHLCVVQSPFGTWERAEITDFKLNLSSNDVEVNLIDTGDVLWVNHKNVFFLNEEFAKLPEQKLHGRCAYITAMEGSGWTLEAVKYFNDLVSHRLLYARIEKVDEEGKKIHLVLVDADADCGTKNINLALIGVGLALRCCYP